jgi:hypothetical protein
MQLVHASIQHLKQLHLNICSADLTGLVTRFMRWRGERCIVKENMELPKVWQEYHFVRRLFIFDFKKFRRTYNVWDLSKIYHVRYCLNRPSFFSLRPSINSIFMHIITIIHYKYNWPHIYLHICIKITEWKCHFSYGWPSHRDIKTLWWYKLWKNRNCKNGKKLLLLPFIW